MIYFALILKILAILSYGYYGYVIISYLLHGDNAKLKLELLSLLEFDASIGIGLVCLFSKVTAESVSFCIIIYLLGIFLANTERHRIIIAGDKTLLLDSKIYRFKDISSCEVKLVIFVVDTKDGKRHRLYAPLTDPDVTARVYKKA